MALQPILKGFYADICVFQAHRYLSRIQAGDLNWVVGIAPGKAEQIKRNSSFLILIAFSLLI